MATNDAEKTAAAIINNQFLDMHRDICNQCPPSMSDSSGSEIGVCSEHDSLSGSNDSDFL